MTQRRWLALALSLALTLTWAFGGFAQLDQLRPGVRPALGAPARDAARLPAPAPGPLSPAEASEAVRTAPRPPRDLYRLTEQVKLRTRDRIPHQLGDTPPGYAVGTVQDFWINDTDNKNYFSIKAQLVYQTEHVHWWVQEGKNVGLNALMQSAERFENEVLPRNRELFGAEMTPGVDGDPRITVMLATTPGAGGYFFAPDSYPKQVIPYSNERKMIYMHVGVYQPGSDSFLSTLAHEYQHMIHRTVRPSDQGWIDEGMSVLAEKLNGFGGGGFGGAFLSRPDTQLNAWAEEPARQYTHYGASFLWMDYFFSHYGGYDGMRNYLTIQATDRLSFDRYLEALGRSERFDDVFADWAVANLVNDRALADGRYGYFDPTNRVVQTDSIDLGATRKGNLNQYGTVYYQVGGQGTVDIAFNGDATVRAIAADPSSGAGMWWANRGDDMNTNMTRNLDLTGAAAATLNVALWYDIEQDFDYAYVEVSDDGGLTWNTLKGKTTTADDPNGQNLGHGLTGKSGGGDRPAWVREQFDLSPWAGKRVQLRFEYVTDDAVNNPGFAWDDLSVPEIGLTDSAEDDGAWQANGFVRLGNALSEKFIVQVVTKGDDGTQVQRLPLSAAQSGSFTIEGLGSTVTNAWVAISGTAEWTTEQAAYTLSTQGK